MADQLITSNTPVFDSILQAVTDFKIRRDDEGIPLLLEPKLLRLSRQVYLHLKMDARIVRDLYFWDVEPSLFGVKCVIDLELTPGTWKLE